MATSSSKEKPDGQKLPARPEGAEVADLLLPADLFWEEHKTKIIAGVIAIVGIAFALIAWNGWQQLRQEKAMAEFASASTPDAWRAVIRKFPNSPAAHNSALLLAADLRERGDLDGSDAAYAGLVESRKPFELQSGAALGTAQNALIRASQNLQPMQSALDALQSVATRFPSGYAAPYSLYVQGDILISEGRDADAAQVFRNLLTDYPNSLSGRMASMQLQRLTALLGEQQQQGQSISLGSEQGQDESGQGSAAEAQPSPSPASSPQ